MGVDFRKGGASHLCFYLSVVKTQVLLGLHESRQSTAPTYPREIYKLGKKRMKQPTPEKEGIP